MVGPDLEGPRLVLCLYHLCLLIRAPGAQTSKVDLSLRPLRRRSRMAGIRHPGMLECAGQIPGHAPSERHRPHTPVIPGRRARGPGAGGYETK